MLNKLTGLEFLFFFGPLFEDQLTNAAFVFSEYLFRWVFSFIIFGGRRSIISADYFYWNSIWNSIIMKSMKSFNL